MKLNWKGWLGPNKEGGKPDYFSVLFPILLVGAVIILVMTNTNRNIPDTAKGEASSQEEVTAVRGDSYAKMLEEKLAEAFSNMAGVGKVKVYVTLAGSGEETVLKDESNMAEEVREEASGTFRSSQQQEQEERTVTDTNGNPYVIRSTYPEVKGVLIVAQGASSAVVREQLLSAASTLLGLSYQQIQVATYQS
ncbi:MAG: hypothetical protein IJ315_07780 [Firmicutes bacterium]|nr:hypothetical protein [Bacillota bacterium]